MSADRFPASLALILTYEGLSFTNDPQDRGGPTKMGVTLRTLSDFCGHACTAGDVEALTRADVQPIYERNYWRPIQGDALPAGLDLICFDGAVNQGVGAVSRMLQRAAGVAADGVIGPVTLAAVAKIAPADLIERVRTARLAAYHLDSGFAHFGTGWTKRLASVAATAHAWAAKVHA